MMRYPRFIPERFRPYIPVIIVVVCAYFILINFSTSVWNCFVYGGMTLILLIYIIRTIRTIRKSIGKGPFVNGKIKDVVCIDPDDQIFEVIVDATGLKGEELEIKTILEADEKDALLNRKKVRVLYHQKNPAESELVDDIYDKSYQSIGAAIACMIVFFLFFIQNLKQSISG